jgi:hypothetical protein
MNKYFHEMNVNPKNKKTSDCVVRALYIVTEDSIENIIRSLTLIYFKTGYFINDKKCYDRYLKDNGYVKHSQAKKANNTKYTGKEFCEYLNSIMKNKTSVFANIGGHHVTTFKNFGNGYVVVDTWDCTDKCVGNWWSKE